MRHRVTQHPLFWFLAGICTAALLLSTLPAMSKGGRSEALYRRLEVLAEVLGLIENQFVETPEPAQLVYSAARGVVAALDDYSAFFAPDEYRALLDATEGELSGVGVELTWDGPWPSVASVVDPSPASRAGLRVGDQITAVDGRSVVEGNLEMVRQALQGPVDTRVGVTVLRGKSDERLYTLTRQWVRVVPVKHQTLGRGIEYVRVESFPRRVANDVRDVLHRHPPKRGLVLDMRGNPGGLFDEAVAICDLFLADGPIVMAVGRDGRVLDQQEAHPGGTEPNYPIVVLIDEQSASAAEVVAGALQDRRRAKLMGHPSFGKGSVQGVFDLSDGSGVKLTIARYVTPAGRTLEGRGLVPDTEVNPKGDAIIARAKQALSGS